MIYEHSKLNNLTLFQREQKPHDSNVKWPTVESFVSHPLHRYRFLLTLTNFLTRVMYRLILYICFLQFQLLQWFPLSMHQSFPFVLI